jgi:hypothetical protein
MQPHRHRCASDGSVRWLSELARAKWEIWSDERNQWNEKLVTLNLTS